MDKRRIDSRNQSGLALNALHDKAFENGLITILPNFKIKVSSIVKREKNNSIKEYFLKYDGELITLPKRFRPDKEFLQYHNDERFRK